MDLYYEDPRLQAATGVHFIEIKPCIHVIARLKYGAEKNPLFGLGETFTIEIDPLLGKYSLLEQCPFLGEMSFREVCLLLGEVAKVSFTGRSVVCPS